MFLSKSKFQSQEDLVENAYCNSCITVSALFLLAQVHLRRYHSAVATTIEITTTIEIIISIVVEKAFQTKLHIATTIKITTLFR